MSEEGMLVNDGEQVPFWERANIRPLDLAELRAELRKAGERIAAFEAMTAATDRMFGSELLTLVQYQRRAMLTAGKFRDGAEAMVAGAVCLAGEVGEFANWVKKVIWHGHPYQREKVVDELGDILWYVARTAETLGISLEEIGEFNLSKLAKRYPDGFSEVRSVNREEGTDGQA